MSRFLFVAAGIALLAWLRYTRNRWIADPAPRWKPGERQ